MTLTNVSTENATFKMMFECRFNPLWFDYIDENAIISCNKILNFPIEHIIKIVGFTYIRNGKIF